MGIDLWRFQRWSREQKVGNPTRKLILTSLAITAEAQTGSGFMAQADLAEYAECSVRTVSDHLKALEDTRLLRRRKRFSKSGRRIADGFLLLAPGVTSWPDGEPVEAASPPENSAGGSPPEDSSSGSPAQSPPEALAAEQEKPFEKPRDKKEKARASSDDRRLSPPDDFPDELRPHARIILPILERIAQDHNAKRVWPLAVGKTLMQFRHKPLVEAVHDLDRWSVDPPRAVKDVVSTYATFLTRAKDLQGVERLNGTGPGHRSAAHSDTVGSANGRQRPDYSSLTIWEGETE